MMEPSGRQLERTRRSDPDPAELASLGATIDQFSYGAAHVVDNSQRAGFEPRRKRNRIQHAIVACVCRNSEARAAEIDTDRHRLGFFQVHIRSPRDLEDHSAARRPWTQVNDMEVASKYTVTKREFTLSMSFMETIPQWIGAGKQNGFSSRSTPRILDFPRPTAVAAAEPGPDRSGAIRAFFDLWGMESGVEE
jgi:hypothetical protein